MQAKQGKQTKNSGLAAFHASIVLGMAAKFNQVTSTDGSIRLHSRWYSIGRVCSGSQHFSTPRVVLLVYLFLPSLPFVFVPPPPRAFSKQARSLVFFLPFALAFPAFASGAATNFSCFFPLLFTSPPPPFQMGPWAL